jgi:putative ABC transport system permease protein
VGDVVIITGFGLIAADELLPLANQLSQSLATSWRFPIDAQALDSDSVDDVVEAIGAFRSAAALLPSSFGGYQASSSLADTVERFHDQQRATAGVRSVATAGLLAVALATIGLVGWLTVARRERTLTLLRARGARISTVVGVVLRESLLVAAPAAVLGGTLALLVVPARPLRGPVIAGVAVFALALALPAVYVYRRHRGLAGSPEPAAGSGSRRATLEILVVVLAVGGTLLVLREPSSSDASTTDVLRAVVPLLLAVTIGLVAQRLLGLTMRPLRRRSTGGRGAVTLLAAAGAVRTATAYTLPVLVVVVAVATTVFVGTVRSTVTTGQVEAAWRTVGAPARLDNVQPGTAAAVAEVPGVCGLTAAHTGSGSLVTASRATRGTSVLVLDVPGYLALVADSPLDVGGLAPLLAPPGDGPVPILASRTPAPTSVTLGETTVRTTVAGTAPPALDTGSGPMVVVPAAAWPGDAGDADRLYLCDQGAQAVALLAAAPGASLQTLASVEAATTAPPLIDSTMSWLVVTAVLTAGFALLAVLLALLATRPRRRREQSLLRTLGLPRRQGRRLGYLSVVPPLAVGLIAGVLAGLGICWVTLHWLDLEALGAGPAVGSVPPWPLLVAIVAAAAVVLAAAVMLEDVLGRARRPAEDLRGGVRE